MEIVDKIKLAEEFIEDESINSNLLLILKDYVEILKNKQEWKDRYIFDFDYSDHENGRYNNLEFKLSFQNGRYSFKEIKDLFKQCILELKDSILIYKFEQVFYFPASDDSTLCYIPLKELFKIIDDENDMGYGPIGENTIEYVISLDNLKTINDDDEYIQWSNR